MTFGVKQVFKLRGLRAAERKVGEIAQADIEDLMKAIGAEVENQTKRRIKAGGPDPKGSPWDDWTERYAGSDHGVKSHQKHASAKRKSGGHSLLSLSGALFDSIQFEADDEKVIVGSNLIYAAVHQFGFKKQSIPKRTYVGLSTKNRADIEILIKDFIMDALVTAAR